MKNLLRIMFLGDWRNKGVAFFFAVAIWFVAFQSEKQEHPAGLTVDLRPQDSERHVIIRQAVPASQFEGGTEPRFDGRLSVTLSGPRKQIEELRRRYDTDSPRFVIDIPPDEEIYHFKQEDFGFPQKGVTIRSIRPESVRVVQDEWATRTFTNIASGLEVSLRAPYEADLKRVDPGEVTVQAPNSIISSLQISIDTELTDSDLRELKYDGTVAVRVFSLDPNVDQAALDVVKVDPLKVDVHVSLKLSEKSIERVMPLTLRIPPFTEPLSIECPDRVAVVLVGPQDDIERLEEELAKENSQVSVNFAIEADSLPTGSGEETSGTFTSSSLIVPRWPLVRVQADASDPGPWYYVIKPCQE